jgi:hypothetical protein
MNDGTTGFSLYAYCFIFWPISTSPKCLPLVKIKIASNHVKRMVRKLEVNMEEELLE